jgi:hypothetical protein
MAVSGHQYSELSSELLTKLRAVNPIRMIAGLDSPRHQSART